MNAAATLFHEIPTLLRGDTTATAAWTQTVSGARVATWLAVTIAGSAAFGAAMGWWREPHQALYTAAKFPLVILLTTLGNALLNAMLAPLLGVNLSLRQSLLAVLMSFTIASAILGAAAPLLAFVIWNAPPLAHAASAGATHAFILLTIVAAIAFAGVAANLRLLRLLRHLSGSEAERGAQAAGLPDGAARPIPSSLHPAPSPTEPEIMEERSRRRAGYDGTRAACAPRAEAAARRVLCAWLVGNLFLGSQLSWVLRPFIGSPGLPVEFLRADPFKGSFYEAVFHSLTRLFSS